MWGMPIQQLRGLLFPSCQKWRDQEQQSICGDLEEMVGRHLPTLQCWAVGVSVLIGCDISGPLEMDFFVENHASVHATASVQGEGVGAQGAVAVPAGQSRRFAVAVMDERPFYLLVDLDGNRQFRCTLGPRVLGRPERCTVLISSEEVEVDTE